MGFFFNISFDANAILKEHFSKSLRKDQKAFIKTHRLTSRSGKNSIFYIPNKALSIRSGLKNHKHYLTCLDISGFVRDGSGPGTLEQAAESFLGEKKLERFNDEDRARLNVDKQFWRDNTNEIIEYCQQDALLTARLAQPIIRSVHEEYGFWLKHLHSSASIIKSFFDLHYPWLQGQFMHATKDNGWFSPLGLDRRQMQLISHSYYGGMFDTWRFGRIKHVKKRDIVSAYPSAISCLPRLDKCKIDVSNRLYNDVAVTGFYKIKMAYCKEIPLPFRYGHRVMFPTMEELTVIEDKSIYPISEDKKIQYVTKPTLEYLIENHADFDILDSVEFVGDYEVAFPEYRQLFEKRQFYKDTRDSCKPNSSNWRFWRP